MKFFNETRASQEKSKLFLRQRNVKNCTRKNFLVRHLLVQSQQ